MNVPVLHTLLIKEIKESVSEAKGFWTRLPYTMCQDQDDEDEGQRRSRGHRQSHDVSRMRVVEFLNSF